MYYIISPVSLSKLNEITPNKCGMSVNEYYETSKGQKLLHLDPLYLDWKNNRKDCFYYLELYFSFLNMFYNCPLYVYVMNDYTFYNTFNLSLRRLSTATKIRDYLDSNVMMKDVEKTMIPSNQSYYGYYTEEDVENNKMVHKYGKHFSDFLDEYLNEINLRQKKIWGFKITNNHGIQKISDVKL